MIKRKIIYSSASLAVCALLILLLAYSDAASGAARDALLFSASSVIPALFAFSVLSCVLSSVGVPRLLTRALPLHRLLGLPECAVPALLCGLIGGLPVGAMLTCSLYGDGRITKWEAARLCAVSSNVSGAFLVGVVGRLFGSHLFGAILWAAQTAVAIGAGLIMRLFGGDGARYESSVEAKEPRLSEVFCDAVAKSSFACVTVTGYIVFFRVIAAIFSELVPLSEGVLLLTFEFSSGTAYSAGIGSAAACGFCVGFGGISALMQVYNYAGKSGIPMLPTFLTKASSAALLSMVGRCAVSLTDTSYASAFSFAEIPALKWAAAIAAAGIAAFMAGKKYFSRGY